MGRELSDEEKRFITAALDGFFGAFEKAIRQTPKGKRDKWLYEKVGRYQRRDEVRIYLN